MLAFTASLASEYVARRHHAVAEFQNAALVFKRLRRALALELALFHSLDRNVISTTLAGAASFGFSPKCQPSSAAGARSPRRAFLTYIFVLLSV
jgi:hypothetical protein